MSGMDPNRAIIALLQMRSDKLVSRDYVRREIPMDLNVTQEEQRVDIEEMRDSLRVAVAQYAQAIPSLAAQGQDPSEIIARIATELQLYAMDIIISLLAVPTLIQTFQVESYRYSSINTERTSISCVVG